MERKEIIQLNGLTILVFMALIADFLVVGFFYRYHNYQIFREEKRHNQEMTELQARQEHDLKIEITALEGATSWGETQYVKMLKIGE